MISILKEKKTTRLGFQNLSEASYPSTPNLLPLTGPPGSSTITETNPHPPESYEREDWAERDGDVN